MGPILTDQSQRALPGIRDLFGTALNCPSARALRPARHGSGDRLRGAPTGLSTCAISDRRITNLSPRWRLTVPELRTHTCSRRATDCSKRSPTTWPNESGDRALIQEDLATGASRARAAHAGSSGMLCCADLLQRMDAVVRLMHRCWARWRLSAACARRLARPRRRQPSPSVNRMSAMFASEQSELRRRRSLRPESETMPHRGEVVPLVLCS